MTELIYRWLQILSRHIILLLFSVRSGDVDADTLSEEGRSTAAITVSARLRTAVSSISLSHVF